MANEKILTGKHSVDDLTVSFETITETRQQLIATDRLIRRNVGLGNTVEKSFHGIIPPQVKNQKIQVGCITLPAPDCISTYKFTKEITNERILDAVQDACDWEHMSGELRQALIADSIAGINEDETANIINYYVDNAIESAVEDDKTLSPRQRINTQIRQAEKYLQSKMGTYAPKRSTFVVYVSADLMAECQNDDLGARRYDMITLDPMINVFGVDAIVTIDENFLNPEDGEIFVTFPTLSFEMIKCETGLSITLLQQEGLKPNTPRLFYYENYEFATFEFPAEVDGEQTLIQLDPAIKPKVTPVA